MQKGKSLTLILPQICPAIFGKIWTSSCGDADVWMLGLYNIICILSALAVMSISANI